MAADFHTHRPKSEAAALVSVPPEQVAAYPCVSLECHPWSLPGTDGGIPTEFEAALAGAAALGEIGLDRHRGPSLEMQRRYLDRLLELAERYQKPAVFHCVHAVPELLAATRGFRPHKLFHGFRGRPELLTELLRHDFFVSFMPDALERPDLAAFVKRRGLRRLGFETDDTAETIECVLARAARQLELEPEQLIRATDDNFREFLNHG